jgi:hypothetical protein
LGDFDLKKNPSLSSEKQIITADPDLTVHDIAEEDEFLALACDGMLLSIVSQSFPNDPTKVFGSVCHRRISLTLSISKSPKAWSSLKLAKCFVTTAWHLTLNHLGTTVSIRMGTDIQVMAVTT